MTTTMTTMVRVDMSTTCFLSKTAGRLTGQPGHGDRAVLVRALGPVTALARSPAMRVAADAACGWSQRCANQRDRRDRRGGARGAGGAGGGGGGGGGCRRGLVSAVREPAGPAGPAGPARLSGDQVVGEQQNGGPGDGGQPGGQVEEPLQAVDVKQLGGDPAAQQCPGDADHAREDEAL